jgi:succinate dehydrogenase / fumarate reductase flavoprotein subunit
MSESLRNDGRIWVPKKKEDARRQPGDIPDEDRDYFLERMYPAYGNLAPRDISSRAAKKVCDEGRGVGDSGLGVYLDFSDAIRRLGEGAVRERYGNLFDIYREITNEDAYKAPMRIFPAVHYTMGGLWVDYNLMSSVPGLFVLGEANFSDHGANRLGASALMQGLADGYFVIPFTIGDYLAGIKPGTRPKSDAPEFAQAEEQVTGTIQRLLSIKGRQPVSHFHKRLGKILWEHCGMARNAKGLQQALREIPALRQEFWENVHVPGDGGTLNQSLEQAHRVADFIELGELMCRDALERDESCGCHFREEHVDAEGECDRNDNEYSHVAAWEYAGENKTPILNKEPLVYEAVKMVKRNYK